MTFGVFAQKTSTAGRSEYIKVKQQLKLAPQLFVTNSAFLLAGSSNSVVYVCVYSLQPDSE